MAGAAAALALPSMDIAQPAPAPDPKSKYPPKVIDLVQRSLVIDMLAPLKLDFTPRSVCVSLERRGGRDVPFERDHRVS